MTTTDAPAADARLLVTVKEAAAMLSIGTTLLYDLIRRGEIATVKVGDLRRVVVASLREYVARQQR